LIESLHARRDDEYVFETWESSAVELARKDSMPHASADEVTRALRDAGR
jgi:hypothetical protein